MTSQWLAAEIRSAGRDAFVVPMDPASSDSIRAAFAKSAKEIGRIDIFINSAAITKDGLAVRMKQADWDAVAPGFIDTDMTQGSGRS